MVVKPDPIIVDNHPKLLHLKNFLGGRPVCFQICGPTIAQLSDHLHLVPDNAVWVAHNFFRSTERILERVGKRLDVVYVSCIQTIQAYEHYYREFLDRPDNNLLITSTGGILAFKPDFLDTYRDKIVIARCEPDAPKREDAFEVVQHGGQIFSFGLASLILLKASTPLFVFFGLDGGWVEGFHNWYYGDESDYPSGWFRGQPGGYGQELDLINREWDVLVSKAGLNPSTFDIYNISLKSQVTCFKRVDYSELANVFKARNGVG